MLSIDLHIALLHRLHHLTSDEISVLLPCFQDLLSLELVLDLLLVRLQFLLFHEIDYFGLFLDLLLFTLGYLLLQELFDLNLSLFFLFLSQLLF